MFCACKPTKQEDSQVQDLSYWKKQCDGRDLKFDLVELNDYLFKFQEQQDKDKKVSLDGFRELIGSIGQSFIGERIFNVICRPGNNYIEIQDYLIYQDKIHNGTEDEKNDISFRMLDRKKKGQITIEDYTYFIE